MLPCASTGGTRVYLSRYSYVKRPRKTTAKWHRKKNDAAINGRNRNRTFLNLCALRVHFELDILKFYHMSLIKNLTLNKNRTERVAKQIRNHWTKL